MKHLAYVGKVAPVVQHPSRNSKIIVDPTLHYLFWQVLESKQVESDSNANDLAAPAAESATSPAATSPFAATAAATAPPPADGQQVVSCTSQHEQSWQLVRRAVCMFLFAHCTPQQSGVHA